MCGITGVFAFNEIGRMHMIHLSNATAQLSKRGPDDFGSYVDYNVGMGHRRLSIIDTSQAGHQPMEAQNGRYSIVFNGEIYNYQKLKNKLKLKGYTFQSESDTEVLLTMYIEFGEKLVEQLDGFFAFAIRDKETDSLFIARDRFGIKPLLYYQDEDKVIFASEMKSLIAYNIPKEIDFESLSLYLELNYLPAPYSILKGVTKLIPGKTLTIKDRKVEERTYYEPKVNRPYKSFSYEKAINELRQRLEKAVNNRLIADVPVGTFLSGGIDSSIISTIAAQSLEELHTFSIGYRDHAFFDETAYAELVAKKIGSKHTVFSLTNDELLEHVHDILDYIDEPFADSSAIPVYILSKKTREHITVALSGDGADEVFSGYNKHHGWLKSLKPDLQNDLLQKTSFLWDMMPKSRSGKISNKLRQLQKYASGLKLSKIERYWLWASITPKEEVSTLFTEQTRQNLTTDKLSSRRARLTSDISHYEDINDFLLNDVRLVLSNDMLTKVDMMSMANGLEVRVPFLQHELVDFAFGLPEHFKIDENSRKKILRDAYKDFLPEELYMRGKKGFEVPLLSWLRKEMLPDLDKKLFNKKIIDQQSIFNWPMIERMRSQLLSKSPGDIHAKIWALYVFQHWYQKHID